MATDAPGIPGPPTSRECDVIVVGAGPAGTAAGAMLAESGRRVVILEKERFPRYRVGESMIPHCWFPLEKIGALDRMRDAGFAVVKRSVQFVSPDGEKVTPFYFLEHSDHPSATTWQVRRDRFDQMLLENATERGAEALMETTARNLLHEDGAVVGVQAEIRSGESIEFRAPMTIDASGRNLFAVTQSDWRVAESTLRKIAIWTYYQGAKRDTGMDEGATTIAYVPEKGWFWFLPLPDDKVSVGIVAERDYLYRAQRDPEEIFNREVAGQPWIRDRLQPGRRIEDFNVTGDYSYRSRYCAANGLILAGDAFAFLDPVFSSGVYLALQSGVMAAEAVDAALECGDVSAGRFADYGERLCHNIEGMRRLVFAFYDEEFSFGTLMKSHPHLRADLTDCLIGNLDRDFTALFEAVSETADIPEPLPYGRPFETETVTNHE